MLYRVDLFLRFINLLTFIVAANVIYVGAASSILSIIEGKFGFVIALHLVLSFNSIYGV